MNDQLNLAYARLALRTAVRHHFSDRNVTMIEFGLKEKEGQTLEAEVAIRFHVRRKLTGFALEMAAERGLTQPIPEKIGSFQTDVAQGTYYPHWRSWPGWWLAGRPCLP